MTFLLTLCTALPSLLNLVGLIMSAFGASKEQLQVYSDMVAKQNASGDLSIISHDRHLSNIAAIEARMKLKEANGASNQSNKTS